MASQLIERQGVDIVRLQDELGKVKSDLRLRSRELTDLRREYAEGGGSSGSAPSDDGRLKRTDERGEGRALGRSQSKGKGKADGVICGQRGSAGGGGAPAPEDVAEKLAGKDEEIGALTRRVKALGTERDQQTAAAEQAKVELSDLRKLLRASEIREKKLK